MSLFLLSDVQFFATPFSSVNPVTDWQSRRFDLAILTLDLNKCLVQDLPD